MCNGACTNTNKSCELKGAVRMYGNIDYQSQAWATGLGSTCWDSTQQIIEQCYRKYKRVGGEWNYNGEHYSLKFQEINRVKPYMGWSSWSLQATKMPGYGFDWLNETNVVQQIGILSQKLRKYGWEYVNLDSGWAGGVDEFGRYINNKEKFPSGMKAMADLAHSKGLKFGVYLIPGVDHSAYDQNLQVKGTNYRFKDFVLPQDANAFGGSRYKIDFTKPGAQEYIDSVVELLAEWGVDFLKLDAIVPGSIVTGSNIDARPDVIAWHKAIEKVGRPIWLTLSWAIPGEDLDVWRPNARAWRIEIDVETYGNTLCSFGDVLRNAKKLAQWTKSYGINPGFQDMDSLLVLGSEEELGMSKNERRTMMNYWVLSASPLYLGVDLTKMDDFGLSLVTNEEVIAIHQRGVPAQMKKSLLYGFPDQQMWWTTNDDGSFTVGLFNLDDKAKTVRADWKYMGAHGQYKVRDLWAREDKGVFSDKFSVSIEGHDSKLYLVVPASA